MNNRDMMSKHQGKAAGVVKALLWIYSTCVFLLLLYMTYQSLRPRSDILGKTFAAPAIISGFLWRNIFFGILEIVL
jgi:hypothetical protein